MSHVRTKSISRKRALRRPAMQRYTLAFLLGQFAINSLLEDVDTALIDDRIKPVYKYLEKLTLTPSRMVRGDADLVFEAGWGENDLEVVIAVCALFSFANRMVDGYGINRQHEQATFDAIGQRLAAGGYTEPDSASETE